MENQTKINVAVILMMIVGFTYVGVEGEEATHYCPERLMKAHCYSLSDSMKTCYTLPAKVGGKRCTNLWKEIPIELTDPMGTIFKCTSKGCISVGEV